MPNQPSELRRQAREFAGKVSRLLNGTVTDGPRLSVTMNRRGNAVIGYRIGKNNPLGDSIPLTTSGTHARVHLHFLHTLDLDDAGDFLTTSRST